MPCLGLPRRLLPARRALKGLSSAVRNGLDRLARAETARNAAAAFRSVFHRARSVSGGRSREVGFESRTQTVAARRCTYEPPRSTRCFEPVYVDELVGGGSGQGSCSGRDCRAAAGTGPGPMKPIGKEDPKPGRRRGPVMTWEVDERAEEFIGRFREEMRLQRERSIEDFKEMLDRGAG